MPVPVPIRVPVVRCKGCSVLIASSTASLPETSIAVLCPLCSARRQYRAAEVYLGSPSHRLRAEAVH